MKTDRPVPAVAAGMGLRACRRHAIGSGRRVSPTRTAYAAASHLAAGPDSFELNPVLPYAWMLFGCLAFSVMAALIHAPRPDLRLADYRRDRAPALALVFATVLTLHAGVKLVFLRPRTFWMRSMAGSVSLVCTFYALARLPVADVLTLTNVFPIWVALLSGQSGRAAREGSLDRDRAWHLTGVVLVQQPIWTTTEAGRRVGAGQLVHHGHFHAGTASAARRRSRGRSWPIFRPWRWSYAWRRWLLFPSDACTASHFAHGRWSCCWAWALRHRRPAFSDQGLCRRAARQGLGRGPDASRLCHVV